MNARVQTQPDPAAADPAAAERAERERRERESWMSQFFSDFSFSSILIFAAVLIGGYFLAKSETGKGWLNSLVDMLPEDWRATAAGFLATIGVTGVGEQHIHDAAAKLTAAEAREKMQGKVPPEVAAIIAADDATWQRVVSRVKEAGGNILNPFAPPVIFHLMKEEPKLVQDILRAVPKDSASSEGRDKLLGALRAITGDATMLTTLFSDKHRSDTLTALELVSPLPFPPGRLRRFIEATGLSNGAPNEPFRQLLAGLLSNDGNARTKALVEYLQASDPKALHGLLLGMKASDLPENVRSSVGPVLALADSETNLRAALQLTRALPPEQLQSIIEAVSTGKADTLLKTLASDGALRTALLAFANSADIAQLPPAWRAPVEMIRGRSEADLAQLVGNLGAIETGFQAKDQSFLALANRLYTANGVNTNGLVGVMLNGEQRALLTPQLDRMALLINAGTAQLRAAEKPYAAFLGTRLATDKAGEANPVNLKAFLDCFEAIGKNPANQGNAASVHAVLTGMVGMLSGAKQAAATLDAAQVANFFRDETNARAFGQLLASIDTRHLPAPQQKLTAMLKTHWGNAQQGLVEILSDRDSVAYLLKPGKGPTPQINQLGWFERALASYVPPTLGGAPGKISENLESLGAIQQALQAAGVTGGAATPAPSAAAAPAGNRNAAATTTPPLRF